MYVNVNSAVQFCISANKNVYREKGGGTKHRATPPLQKVGDVSPVHLRIYTHEVMSDHCLANGRWCCCIWSFSIQPNDGDLKIRSAVARLISLQGTRCSESAADRLETLAFERFFKDIYRVFSTLHNSTVSMAVETILIFAK